MLSLLVFMVQGAVTHAQTMFQGYTAGVQIANVLSTPASVVLTAYKPDSTSAWTQSDTISGLAYQGRFFLLNVNPESPSAGRQDLLVIDIAKSPALRTEPMAAAGALWGTIEGDTLYTYHNIEYLDLKRDPFRGISRFNLSTGETKLWSLPDHWDARDLAFVNGDIILAHSISQEPENDGVYRFELQTSKLTMLVHILGATRVLPPAP